MGEIAGGPFAERWDPRSDFKPGQEADLGWIGEDAQGVWIAVHPQVALAEHPLLGEQVARFASGMQEVSESDWEKLSAYEFEQKRTMLGARRRKQERDLKRKPRSGEDGE